MKTTIIAIVGASGSGKTALSAYLQKALGIPYLVSFTTRPMRNGELNGIDHYFVPIEEAPDPAETFAYTYFGGHHYWTNREQIDKEEKISYVIDEKGLTDLWEKWGDTYNVISVYVKRPNNPTDATRKSRDLDRIQIPEDKYDIVLVNDSSINDFFKQAIYKLAQYMDKIQK